MNEFLEKLDKEREYKEYVVYHIKNVEDAFNRLILPLKGKYSDEVDSAINQCGQVIPLHDISKFSKAEFDPYRLHFYPTPLEKATKDIDSDWEQAVQHHYLVNPHHPMHWQQLNQDMPLQFIFEMLCDWAAVSCYKKSMVTDYYDNYATKEKAAFSPKTKEMVDYWIDEIFRKPGIDF